MSIPNEAIEAAAMAIYQINGYGDSGRELDDYRPDARASLEAAAPILLAEAWGVARILAESRIEGDRPDEDLEWAKAEYRKRPTL